MIYRGPALTAAQQRSSQINYNYFNSLNGTSYMCTGEVVILLFAMKLDCPDYFVAILGALLYFSYLALPLGKVVAARVGAAQSQAVFWVMRNVSALIIASASVVVLFGARQLALGLVLVGGFLFYACRNAGIALSQPLVAEITSSHNRARFIGRTTALFYISALAALAVVSGLTRLTQSVWMLTAIIVFGSLVGITSSKFIRRIDETENLRISAAKPLYGELVHLLAVNQLNWIITVGFFINLGVIFMIPTSMLVLKRGYGVNDSDALIFSMVQYGCAIFASYHSGKLINRFGARQVMLFAYSLLLAIGAFWLVAPCLFHWYFAAIPFAIAGCASVTANNAFLHYFLTAIPEKRRVSASMVISVIIGAGAGIVGMLLGSWILKLIESHTPDMLLLNRYRIFFVSVILAASAGVLAIRKLRNL